MVQNAKYISTGSAKPVEGGIIHTGTGRVTKLQMMPVSLYESKDSDDKVSLEDIIEGKDISGVSKLDLDGIINAMIRGGWPDS